MSFLLRSAISFEQNSASAIDLQLVSESLVVQYLSLFLLYPCIVTQPQEGWFGGAPVFDPFLNFITVIFYQNIFSAVVPSLPHTRLIFVIILIRFQAQWLAIERSLQMPENSTIASSIPRHFLVPSSFKFINL